MFYLLEQDLTDFILTAGEIKLKSQHFVSWHTFTGKCRTITYFWNKITTSAFEWEDLKTEALHFSRYTLIVGKCQERATMKVSTVLSDFFAINNILKCVFFLNRKKNSNSLYEYFHIYNAILQIVS